jgi:hypothetical protein
VDLKAFRNALPWQDEVIVDAALFAHAGPFGKRDWTYVESNETVARASKTLEERGLQLGVFGHTHRSYTSDTAHRTKRALAPGELRSFDLANDAPCIINPGSLGQPRGDAGVSTLLLLDTDDTRVDARLVSVNYDLQAMERAYRASGLSETTSQKLLSYLREAGGG